MGLRMYRSLNKSLCSLLLTLGKSTGFFKGIIKVFIFIKNIFFIGFYLKKPDASDTAGAASILPDYSPSPIRLII
jgi:hypothetical protein